MSDEYFENQADQVEDDDVEFILPANQSHDQGRRWEETKSIVHGLHAKLGFAIEENDPEAADVPWQTVNPDAFREAYRNALARKAARLGVTTQQARRQPAPAPQPAQPKKADYTSEYRKAMDAAIKRGAGSIEKVELRAKYRRLGVDVDNARGEK